MEKRWLSLLVENEVGVLATIAGLFSGKYYNLNSLTVGTTEDKTISRMTIGLTSDDKTFEQIKKQLNRRVEIITVTDLTHFPIYSKELMFIKINQSTQQEKTEIARITNTFKIKSIPCNGNTTLLESVMTEEENNSLVQAVAQIFANCIQIVRSGSVAVETDF